MEMSAHQPAYVLRGCDPETVASILPKILSAIGSRCSNNDPNLKIIVLSCSVGCENKGSFTLSQYFMWLCRQFKLLPNERYTLLSSIDQIISIQLLLAEKNKQLTGEYDVEASTVLQTYENIVTKKLSDKELQKEDSLATSTETNDSLESDIMLAYGKFLTYCNYCDMCDILNLVKDAIKTSDNLQKEIFSKCFLFLDSPTNKVEREMVQFLCDSCTVEVLSVEVPLCNSQPLCEEEEEEDEDNSQLVVVDFETCNDPLDSYFTDQSNNLLPTPAKQKISVSESFVQLVFVSYLELLVNSRSELALARSLNTPERELNHAAFTDIKHAAKEKGMTMYQTAVSFVMKIRLGGKGYAPDPNCPMAKHVKGLGDFVTLVQKLQTIVEEDLDKRSSCRRVLNVVKKTFIQCRGNKIKSATIESVCDQLQKEVLEAIDFLDSVPVEASPGKAARDGGSLVGQQTLKVIRCVLDKLVSGMDQYKKNSLDFLFDGFSTQATPLRIPCLLSQFRSPEENSLSPDSFYNKSLAERLQADNTKTETPIYKKRFKSSLTWADEGNMVDPRKDDIIMTQSAVTVLPCITMVQPGSAHKSYKAGIARKITDSLLDQENLPENITSNTTLSESIGIVHNGEVGVIQGEVNANKKNAKNQKSKKGEKRKNDVELSQPTKKAKTKESKTVRRKLLPQVKGQQQLTKFFRV